MSQLDGQIRLPGLVLMSLGERRVGRVEYVAPAELPALERALRARLGERLHLHAEPGPDGRLDLFYGYDADENRAVAGLAVAAAQENEDRAALLALSAEIGRRLGYPPCCAEAFAAMPFFELERNEWAYLRRRCEAPGPLPAALNPFEGLTLGHVPCSPHCAATQAQAARVEAALVEREPEALAAILALARRPVLFLLDVVGNYVVLEDPLEEREAPCRVHKRVGLDPRLAAFAGGERVRLAPGLVTVGGAGGRVATFAMSCGLWWHERALDANWWVAAARAGHLEDESESGPAGVSDPAALPRLLRNAMRALEAYAEPIAARTGYRLRGLRAADEELHVELISPKETVVLVVRLAGGEQRLAASGRYLSVGRMGRAILGDAGAGGLIRFVHGLLETVIARKEG